MRQIIQIANDADGDLVGLCNDGTCWYMSSEGWKLFADIPQDGYVDEEEEALQEALNREEPEHRLDSVFDNLEGPNVEAITRYLNDALNPDEDIDWEDQLDGSNLVPCYVSDSDIDDESMQYNPMVRVISYRPLHERPYIDVEGVSWKYAVPIGG